MPPVERNNLVCADSSESSTRWRSSPTMMPALGVAVAQPLLAGWIARLPPEVQARAQVPQGPRRYGVGRRLLRRPPALASRDDRGTRPRAEPSR